MRAMTYVAKQRMLLVPTVALPAVKDHQVGVLQCVVHQLVVFHHGIVPLTLLLRRL